MCRHRLAHYLHISWLTRVIAVIAIFGVTMPIVLPVCAMSGLVMVGSDMPCHEEPAVPPCHDEPESSRGTAVDCCELDLVGLHDDGVVESGVHVPVLVAALTIFLPPPTKVDTSLAPDASPPLPHSVLLPILYRSLLN